MAALWPPGIPFFNRADGHSRTGAQGAVVRTPMDAGPAKARRRSTAAPRGYGGLMVPLEPQDFATFEDFVAITLADGALPFTVDDPYDGLSKTFRFVDDPPYKAQPAGKRMAVTASLEIVARPARSTVSIAARISGDPTQAFVGDTLYAIPAVYAGEAGTLSHEWFRVSTGAVVGTSDRYAAKTGDLFDSIGYRTKAINGPTSTATAQPAIAATEPSNVVRFDADAVIFGVEFMTFTAAGADVLTYDGDQLTYDSDPLTFNAA